MTQPREPEPSEATEMAATSVMPKRRSRVALLRRFPRLIGSPSDSHDLGSDTLLSVPGEAAPLKLDAAIRKFPLLEPPAPRPPGGGGSVVRDVQRRGDGRAEPSSAPAGQPAHRGACSRPRSLRCRRRTRVPSGRGSWWRSWPRERPRCRASVGGRHRSTGISTSVPAPSRSGPCTSGISSSRSNRQRPGQLGDSCRSAAVSLRYGEGS